MKTAKSERTVRIALLSNATFSAASGLALMSMPGILAAMLPVVQTQLIRGVGLGLLLFALYVGVVGGRRKIRALEAVVISLADFSWVVGTILLLALLPGALENGLGTGVALAVAAIVASFAIAQLIGVRRSLREARPHLGEWHHCIAVPVDAGADAMWRVVSDLASIARYLPTLKHSSMRDGRSGGAEIGRVRECASLKGEHWAEQVTECVPEGRHFTLRFLTEERGFPYPMKVMYGGWSCASGKRA